MLNSKKPLVELHETNDERRLYLLADECDDAMLALVAGKLLMDGYEVTRADLFLGGKSQVNIRRGWHDDNRDVPGIVRDALETYKIDDGKDFDFASLADSLNE